MIFEKGYTVRKVNTSHGLDLYISRFGEIVSVLPYSPKFNLSKLIKKIDSMNY